MRTPNTNVYIVLCVEYKIETVRRTCEKRPRYKWRTRIFCRKMVYINDNANIVQLSRLYGDFFLSGLYVLPIFYVCKYVYIIRIVSFRIKTVKIDFFLCYLDIILGFLETQISTYINEINRIDKYIQMSNKLWTI